MAILTISREFGSGGREIGHAAATLLNYEYLDKEGMLSDLKTAGSKWEEWWKDFDEHRPTVWEKYDWSFRGLSALLQSCLLDHALKGNVVIMGRGGNFLLEGIPSAWRVRIVAPPEKRIEKIMIRESVDKETAKWLAEKTDNERASFIRSVYGREWDDPDGYDVIFDTDRRDEGEIVKIIRDNLLEKEQTVHPTETLRMRAAAARVKAGLLTNPKLFIPTLDVYYDGEGIVLRGVVHSSKEHKTVEEEARRMAEGLPLRCELHYRK